MAIIYDEFLTEELINGFQHAVVDNGIVGKPVSFGQLTKTTSAEELYTDTDEAATDIKCWGSASSLMCTIISELTEDMINFGIIEPEPLRPLSRSERRSKGSKYEASRYKRKRNNVKEYF